MQIIRAGFISLYQAVKIIINPPKNMPKDEIYFEASKIFVSGMISAISMLRSKMIHKFLLPIPGFNVFLSLPNPFTNETIGGGCPFFMYFSGWWCCIEHYSYFLYG